MIELRPFSSLGAFDNDWLSARYHFSFYNYYDPDRLGVGPLIVWNDDAIRAGTGFPMHPHEDMEIITYIRRGAISHEDDGGNKGRTTAGNVQVMSAGRGVYHSEFNFEEEDLTLFQIWIRPSKAGVEPRWDSREFPREPGRLIPLASGRPEHDGALMIHQDAAILGATLKAGQTVTYPLRGRQAYLVAAKGSVIVNGTRLTHRDGAVITDEDTLSIEGYDDAEVVLADLPL